MRFARGSRCEYTVTDRKRAAAVRSQRRQREALPLLGELIAETQPGIDDLMASRVERWNVIQQQTRDTRAQRWRRARRELDLHPPPVRAALLAYWNGHRWLPGDPVYLLDALHEFRTGQLVLVDGKVERARVTISASEALAAFGSPKPRAREWIVPVRSSPKELRAGTEAAGAEEG